MKAANITYLPLVKRKRKDRHHHRRKRQHTVLKVRDNGLGISEKDIHLIFQKFERASAVKRNSRNGASGFGLGLNFVDQVIKAHEGRIYVTSMEEEFTEFSIYLSLTERNEPTENC